MTSKLLTIGIFTDTYYPYLNGVTTSVENLVSELRKKHHRVYVIAPEVEGYKDHDPDIIRIPSHKVLPKTPQVRFPLLIPDKRYKTAYSKDFDIIHAHGNGAFSLLGHQIAGMKNIPYVLTFHTVLTEYTHYLLKGMLITPKLMEAVLRFLAQMCDGVVTPSEKMRKKLLSYGVEKDIVVISNIIDTSLYRPGKQTGIIRKKLGISSSDIVLLSVGRLEKEKNFQFLLKMFAKVKKDCPQAHLVIVGTGNEEQSLRDLSESLSLQDSVHFIGRIEAEDMPRVYTDADFFVFASTTETQGMVVLEAGSCGLPLVVIKDASYKGIIEDGYNGYSLPLVEKAFVEKTRELCTNHILRQTLSHHSRELIEKNFDPTHITDQFVTYYQSLIAHHTTKQRMILNSTLLKGMYELMRRFDEFVRKL